MFYLTMYLTYFIYIIWLYGTEHVVKDHLESEGENLQPPLNGLLFSVSSKGSFICTIP